MKSQVQAVDKCIKCPLVNDKSKYMPTCGHPCFDEKSEPYSRIVTFGKGFHRNCPLQGKIFQWFENGEAFTVYLRKDSKKHFGVKDSSFSKVSYAV